MKKAIKIVFVAAFSMIAGYNVYKSQNVADGKETLILTEVEALAASSERGCVNGTQNWGYCFVDGTTYRCDDYWIWNCVTALN